MPSAISFASLLQSLTPCRPTLLPLVKLIRLFCTFPVEGYQGERIPTRCRHYHCFPYKRNGWNHTVKLGKSILHNTSSPNRKVLRKGFHHSSRESRCNSVNQWLHSRRSDGSCQRTLLEVPKPVQVSWYGGCKIGVRLKLQSSLRIVPCSKARSDVL